jgi:hypothetical protein
MNLTYMHPPKKMAVKRMSSAKVKFSTANGGKTPATRPTADVALVNMGQTSLGPCVND